MVATKVAASAVAVIVLVPALLSAQAKTDFSGTWTLDRKASAINDGGKNEGRGAGLPTATEMVIKQSATEMAVNSTAPDSYAFSGNPVPAADGLFRFNSTYKLDGSEFQANCPPCDATGKSTWAGGKLTISAKRKLFAGALGFIETEDVDVYSLSGDILTLERTVDTVDGPQTRKLVYNRKK
jgi:hypothetical protein